MGESYFHRKLFGKLKRVKTQPSIHSIQSLPSLTDSVSRLQDGERGQDEQVFHGQSSESSGLVHHQSTSADLIRCDAGSAPADSDESKGPQPEQLPGAPRAAGQADSGSPSPQESGQSTTSAPNNNNTQKPIKLRPKTRSRAILLFRRAASSLAHGGSSASSAQNPQPVSRQNTTNDPNNNNSQAPTRSHRFASLTLRMNSSSSAANVNEQHNNSTCLPRFIVPKMNALNLPIVCLIKSLDGELMREVFVHRYELGQYLIDSLKVSLGLKDSKYFGLKMAKCLDDQEDVRQPWLDLNESVCKQISKTKLVTMVTNNQSGSGNSATKSINFYLRIKYYPPNLTRVQDSFLRQYLWLQLKRDLRLGKLTSSMNNLTLLMACILQYELGDYSPDLVDRWPELNILPNQDLIEVQAIELWRTRLNGMKKHQVRMQFLRAAVIMETYGFDYYPVRDHQRQRAYLLGFNYNGIKTIRNGRIIHHFRWHSLSKISYERRMIIFHIYPTENSKVSH